MSVLNKAQQIFLQAFMARGLLVSGEVRSAFKMSCRAASLDPDQGSLVDWVRAINLQLVPMHLEIKKAVSEQTGAQYYGLVSTAETDISKLASTYSENEYEFFKKIIEVIVESDVGSVSSTDALNVTDQLEKKMTKKEAQDLLQRLKEDCWIDLSPEGRVLLSTRCILEMDQYIHEQFPEAAINCDVCNRLCIQGQLCDRCDVRLHTNCAARFFSRQEPKCPNDACKAPWTHEIPECARPNREGGSPSKTQSSQAAGSSQSHTRKRKATQH